ncbi:MAG: hypothetical protein H6Q76_178 [Firmicutes bacterium]|nr:hypothetical protein [Bacillota bacterium]
MPLLQLKRRVRRFFFDPVSQHGNFKFLKICTYKQFETLEHLRFFKGSFCVEDRLNKNAARPIKSDNNRRLVL